MAETPRTALVVEGGGMRGSYAAGALVELLRQDPHRYDAAWATSSGAASTAYGLAGQPEGINIWRDWLHGRRLVHPLRFVTGRSALDIHYLVDTVFRNQIPLDVPALHANGVPLHVPATDVADGTVRYFDLSRRDPFPVLKAAMALPGAVLEPVPIDDALYVDGGVVDQLPIARALDAGATDLTVVVTRPAADTPRPTGAFGTWLATRRFPGIRHALGQRHRGYTQALALIRRPPDGVRIRVIGPSAPLPVKRWTTSRQRIIAAIEQGLADAQGHQPADRRRPVA
jgi:predicted patatin/cPLA2 family phospholipase